MALGEEDFGIYNLVAGMLVMLTFLNNSMASSTQRFLSYSQGRGDPASIQETFFLSCILHLIIGICVFLIVEAGGLLLMNTVLQIPPAKNDVAVFVLHTLAISTFLSVVSVPYSASLIAHENMLFVAIMQFSGSVLKLGVAIVLLHFMGNRLKLYAVAMASIEVLMIVAYRAYCHRNYQETRYKIHRPSDFTLLRQFVSYTGWNFIGGVSDLLRKQGVALLLNSWYGVVVNAAYGIAAQVNSHASFFSSAIMNASRPQIVKSEGMGNRKRMHELSATTCKVTFLMLAMLAVPLLSETPYILELWLKDVPDYTVEFTRLLIIQSLVFQLTLGVYIGIESVGQIKLIQLTVGLLHFLVIPVGWCLLKLGSSPGTVLWMVVGEQAVSGILTLAVSKKVTGLHVGRFISGNMIPCILAFSAVSGVCRILTLFVPAGIGRLSVVSLLSLVLIPVICYVWIMNEAERRAISKLLTDVIRRIRAK